MYEKIYICKMCGKKLEMGASNRIEADINLLIKNDRVRHICDNGDLGVAEFAGYKKITI